MSLMRRLRRRFTHIWSVDFLLWSLAALGRQGSIGQRPPDVEALQLLLSMFFESDLSECVVDSGASGSLRTHRNFDQRRSRPVVTGKEVSAIRAARRRSSFYSSLCSAQVAVVDIRRDR